MVYMKYIKLLLYCTFIREELEQTGFIIHLLLLQSTDAFGKSHVIDKRKSSVNELRQSCISKIFRYD